MMRDELAQPLNMSPVRSRREETFEEFIEEVFIPMKRESGEWRENTAKESTREIRRHLVSELGEVTFEELSPALLRAVLRKKADQGFRRQALNHLKGYLSDICQCAVAEGYLEANISEGLKAPLKLARPVDSKLAVTLDQYAQAWILLDERERPCFDLVMFAGMRESAAFAVWCGDITADGIQIERSWYKRPLRDAEEPENRWSP